MKGVGRMLMYNDIFNDKTLNIFTDASMTKYGNETIGCYGIITVTTNVILARHLISTGNNIRRSIVRYSTNNDSELRGILQGIFFAIEYRDDFETINLFSDSMISIMGLKVWLNNWIQNTRNGIMYSTSGEVMNQELIKDIVFTILHNSLNINLYHQKGHVNSKNIQHAKQTFIRTNGLSCDVDMKLIETISNCNDIIDNITRENLGLYMNNLYQEDIQKEKLSRAICFDIDQFDLKKYNELIGGNIK